jgi:hypothetical protein
VLAGESLDDPVIGRLVERGLDDELKGTAYAVVDGVDGRTHHIKLPDLDAAGDSAPARSSSCAAFDDAKGERRVALAVRSDLDIERRSRATARPGSTGRLIAREPVALGRWRLRRGGADAMDAARRASGREGSRRAAAAQRIIFSRNLIDTLRQRELDALGDKLATETGRRSPARAAANMSPAPIASASRSPPAASP